MRRQAVNLPPQLLLGNFKINRFSIEVRDVQQPCGPVDLDHVPLRVFEVECQLDGMTQ